MKQKEVERRGQGFSRAMAGGPPVTNLKHRLANQSEASAGSDRGPPLTSAALGHQLVFIFRRV
ncbi:hypothetical protein EYF80_028650 [Liparis tanakae]|uniref:Uncharacterized protein n=1 Tax=Liparis tanakae TaxID=230148 RepID=A0A4Z2H8P7_9TELE|nr:hypothetical protein EYF80_028650 [Liparis tanakae]